MRNDDAGLTNTRMHGIEAIGSSKSWRPVVGRYESRDGHLGAVRASCSLFLDLET